MHGAKDVKNITAFCRLRKSTVETPVSLSVVNGDEVFFKKLLCTSGTTDFNSLELLENKEHSSRPVVLSNENVATFIT